MMMSGKLAIWAATALTGALGLASQAHAESTGSQEQEVIITAAAHAPGVAGAVISQTVTKSRTSITQEYIDKLSAGQSIAQTLNVVTPGYNFTNNDPYGSSGGNLRLRGFDGNRVSLTWDGVPLNDTGNYAIFTNQLLDPEIVEQTNVNTGTTDVDSPTASAVGGTVNIITRKPAASPGAQTSFTGGYFNYGRAFAMIDTGQVFDGGPSAFLAVSKQDYAKFKGPGSLDKKQINARLYQPLSGRDFISLAFHYNENRNNNYRTDTLANFALNGREEDFDYTCARPTPGAGAQVEATSGVLFNCTNYFGRQVNPSNTGNIRGQSSFSIADNLRFTFDPSFQYVLADGGGQLGVISETDGRVKGASAALGKDLNGDGDILDTVAFFTPSVTNTRRYGATSSLIWDMSAHQRIRVAGTYDYGRHRQTGEYTFLDSHGNPADVFGGKDGHGPKVLTADGANLEARNRFSIAELQQIALEYRGMFMDDRLTLNIGLRAPEFTRELHQFCYSQNGSSNVRCTTEPVATTLANGNVTFAGSATQFIKPYSLTKQYNATLPNVGVSYKLTARQSVYASYAEGLSAPRTDNLYTVTRLASGSISTPNVSPETTRAYDLGWRFGAPEAQMSVSVWDVEFTNRIVTSFDPDLGANVDRNVGNAREWGLDAQAGVKPLENLTLIGAFSYNNSQLLSNYQIGVATAANGVFATGAPLFLPTKGRRIVETPEWTVGSRLQWDVSDAVHLGVQNKYVGRRFSTDVNDEYAPAYDTWDADLRVDLPPIGFAQRSVLQVNVNNLFGMQKFGSISSRSASKLIPGIVTATTASGGVTPASPTYNVMSPLAVQISLKSRF